MKNLSYFKNVKNNTYLLLTRSPKPVKKKALVEEYIAMSKKVAKIAKSTVYEHDPDKLYANITQALFTLKKKGLVESPSRAFYSAIEGGWVQTKDTPNEAFLQHGENYLLTQEISRSICWKEEEVETPTEEVETPTEEVETPTEEVETPTEEVETPTEEAVETLAEEAVETLAEEVETLAEEAVETLAEEVETPTEEAVETPTEEVETPTEEVVETLAEEVETPTEEVVETLAEEVSLDEILEDSFYLDDIEVLDVDPSDYDFERLNLQVMPKRGGTLIGCFSVARGDDFLLISKGDKTVLVPMTNLVREEYPNAVQVFLTKACEDFIHAPTASYAAERVCQVLLVCQDAHNHQNPLDGLVSRCEGYCPVNQVWLGKAKEVNHV